jgi:hypothetical protein
MAKSKRKPKCTVVFTTSSRGPNAVLFWKGHSLNAINYPKNHAITAKEKASARKTLMRGCAEMVRDVKRAHRQG